MRLRMPHKAVTEQHTFPEPAHVFYYHIMIIGCSVCILCSVGFRHFGFNAPAESGVLASNAPLLKACKLPLAEVD